jgi:hypothetical protein
MFIKIISSLLFIILTVASGLLFISDTLARAAGMRTDSAGNILILISTVLLLLNSINVFFQSRFRYPLGAITLILFVISNFLLTFDTQFMKVETYFGWFIVNSIVAVANFFLLRKINHQK